jgi:hypothetical protein
MALSARTRQEEYVVGEVARYWAPSIVLADRALSAIAAAIKRTDDSAQLAKLSRDLDRCLERRLVLELEQAVVRKA